MGFNDLDIINENNIDKFIDALCKASVMSVGCENHEKYHKRVKEFVEKTTGDMSCFEKYGFSANAKEKTKARKKGEVTL